MPRLYYYNPDHDLALASGSEHYQAPESAMILGADLNLLPCWYAEPGSMILGEGELPSGTICRSGCTVVNSISPENIDSNLLAEPWGWNPAVRKYFKMHGVPMSMLPTNERLDKIKALSHRRISIKALQYIHSKISDNAKLPILPVETASMADVRALADEHGMIVLKAPWSGSGRGVFFTPSKMSTSIEGWANRVIERQGSLMVEPAYSKVQDFAMEFKCTYGEVRDMGYSLFYTANMGVYRGNRLMSNAAIESILSRYTSIDHLHALRTLLMQFIKEEIAPFYNGYVGVDMLVYKSGNDFRINPVIEINVRTTMGLVARSIFDNYISPAAQGAFIIDHRPPCQLETDDINRTIKNPLVLTPEGRIAKGYLSLCPINENTIYRAAIIVD